MTENVFDEIMPENFPNIKKETDIQVQKEKRVPDKVKPRKYPLRYIIIIKGFHIWLLADFLQEKKTWNLGQKVLA